jgi:DNA-binding transcriptional ArsR family regulator
MTMNVAGEDAPVTEPLTAAACLFHGFSDPTRLAIVRHLALGEHRVVDLTRHVGLAQSTVSRHLACLVDCGLVIGRPQGRATFYALAHPDATMRLFAATEELLSETGEAVTLCANYGPGALRDAEART